MCQLIKSSTELSIFAGRAVAAACRLQLALRRGVLLYSRDVVIDGKLHDGRDYLRPEQRLLLIRILRVGAVGRVHCERWGSELAASLGTSAYTALRTLSVMTSKMGNGI